MIDILLTVSKILTNRTLVKLSHNTVNTLFEYTHHSTVTWKVIRHFLIAFRIRFEMWGCTDQNLEVYRVALKHSQVTKCLVRCQSIQSDITTVRPLERAESAVNYIVAKSVPRIDVAIPWLIDTGRVGIPPAGRDIELEMLDTDRSR